MEQRMGLCSGQRASLPFPDRSPPRTLTGHLVMSSGQMWAPLEAGSSQVLEAEVGGGKMWGLGIPSLPRPLASTPSLPRPPAPQPATPTGQHPQPATPTSQHPHRWHQLHDTQPRLLRELSCGYLGSWLHTAPEVRFWPRSDLSMGGPVSSCHLTKVARVSWRMG